jgi:large subunit ribosomal protein L29
MKAKELREMTGNELRERLAELKKDLINLRLQFATGVVENVRAARNTRREIARILTILRERELAAQKGKVS